MHYKWIQMLELYVNKYMQTTFLTIYLTNVSSMIWFHNQRVKVNRSKIIQLFFKISITGVKTFMK